MAALLTAVPTLPQVAIVDGGLCGAAGAGGQGPRSRPCAQKGEMVMDAALDAARILEQVIMVRQHTRGHQKRKGRGGGGGGGGSFLFLINAFHFHLW